MASRGFGTPFPQAGRPEQWTEWSIWEWSRENTEGKVEWQYSDGAAGENRSQSLPAQPAQDISAYQQPRYAPSGLPVFQQSSIPQNQPLRTSSSSSTQGYPSSYPNSMVNQYPSVSTTGIYAGSTNQYGKPTLTRYQPTQNSSAAYVPSSFQDRNQNQRIGAYQESFSNKIIKTPTTTTSNVTSGGNQEYYQQKSSDNYTSGDTSSGKGYYEVPKISPQSYQPYEEYSSLSQNISNEETQRKKFINRSLAEEMDDMSIEPSIPVTNISQRNKGYQTEFINNLDDDDAEEDEEGYHEKPYMTEQPTRRLSTTENIKSNRSVGKKKPALSRTSNRTSQTSSKPSSTVKELNERRKITAKNLRINPDVLDERFCVEPSTKFETFMVFMMLWSEPRGYTGQTEQTTDSNEDASVITVAKLGESAYHSIRRFVIVVEKRGHSLCLPILTYTGQGTLKSGVKQEEHAIIYTGDKPPPQLEGEDNIYKKPVRMIGITKRDKLDPKSRINYSKIYTVEHNVKVCFIGYIDSDSEVILLTDYKRSVDPPRVDRSAFRNTARREKGDAKSSEKDRNDRKKGYK